MLRRALAGLLWAVSCSCNHRRSEAPATSVALDSVTVIAPGMPRDGRWIQITPGPPTTVWLDSATMDRRFPSHASGWIMWVFSKRQMLASGTPYTTTKQPFNADCTHRTLALGRNTVYSDSGSVLFVSDSSGAQTRVVPESIGEEIFDAVCPGDTPAESRRRLLSIAIANAETDAATRGLMCFAALNTTTKSRVRDSIRIWVARGASDRDIGSQLEKSETITMSGVCGSSRYNPLRDARGIAEQDSDKVGAADLRNDFVLDSLIRARRP